MPRYHNAAYGAHISGYASICIHRSLLADNAHAGLHTHPVIDTQSADVPLADVSETVFIGQSMEPEVIDLERVLPHSRRLQGGGFAAGW